MRKYAYTQYDIKPVPKPRMTQSDKWKKRKCVVNYFTFKHLVRCAGIELPDYGAHVIFGIPMPNSWSKKKKLVSVNREHKQKPDIDNLLKALLDVIFDEDSHISDIRVTKCWTDGNGYIKTCNDRHASVPIINGE